MIGLIRIVQMRQETSKKITLLNFILIALIVLLHSNNSETSDYRSVLTGGYFAIDLIYTSLTRICETAVPTFFALSGYLFFRNLTRESLIGKVKRRLRTLLIPYLFWNSIFYLVYFVMERIPFIASRINMGMPDFNFWMLIFENYSNPPLWFLLKLFCLQLVSPLVFVAMKKVNKNIITCTIIAIAIADIVFDFGYSNFFHWMPIYFGAGFISYYYSGWVEKACEDWMQQRKRIILLCAVGVFFFGVLVKSIQWLTAPVVWWGVMSCVKAMPYKEFMKESFFVFCSHYFLILVVRKVFVNVLGVSPIKMIVAYLATFVLTLLITVAVGMAIKKCVPKLHYVLCGGR